MSTISATDLDRRIELLETKLIGEHLDKVIGEIQDLAKKFDITKDKKEKSPFRNVLTVATEPGSSLEVIKNYIRYQVGRQGSSKIWKDNNGAFAKALVNALDGLKTDASKIIESIETTLSQIYAINESSQENKSDQNSKESDAKESDARHLISSYLKGSMKEKLQKKLHLKLAQLYLGYLAREHTALLQN